MDFSIRVGRGLMSCALFTVLAITRTAVAGDPSSTGDSSLETRLEAVENWIKSNDPMKAANLDEPAKNALVRTGIGNVSLDGNIQMWIVDDPSGVYSGSDSKFTFRPRRAEIKLSGEILPMAGFTVMFDPARRLRLNTRADEEGALLSAEVDQTSNILQDLWVEFRLAKVFTDLQSFAPNLKLLIGQQKPPVTEEGYRAASKIDLVERSLLARAYDDRRDIGALLMDTHDHFDYQVGIFNGSGSNRSDDNNDKSVAGHFALKPVKGFAVGAFGFIGSRGPDEKTQDRWGFDSQFEQGIFSLKAEYARGKDDDIDSQGLYVQPAVMLTEKTQLVTRYDWFDPNVDGSDDTICEVAANLNYFIYKNNAKIQVEYLRRNNDASSDSNIFLSNFQVTF